LYQQIVVIYVVVPLPLKGLSRSYGSRIYNYLCHQCLSSLTWVQVQYTQHYMIKVCQWLAAGLWLSLGTPVSSTKQIVTTRI